MFAKTAVIALAALSAVSAAPAPQTTDAPAPAPPAPASAFPAELFRDLLTAPTVVQRFKRLLVQGEELISGEALKKLTVFDFNGAVPAGKGGATKAANIETFPILTELGISTTLGFLDKCGINTPHVHPRATEFLTLVEGNNLEFGYVLENGLVGAGKNPEIAGSLSKFQGTVFPQGSIHFQFNNNCEPAVFVATLNSADPGTSQVAQNFFALNADVINATLGFPDTIDGKNIAEFRKSIPANIAQDVEGCLARCNGQGAPTPYKA